MAGISSAESDAPVVHSKACVFEIRRDAVRVKAKKVDGFLQPEYRRFSVDPQITTFEVLVALLARAFDIPTYFTISYVAHDNNSNQDVYVSLLSDWDLDAAFLSSSHPHLRLKVDVKPFEPGLEDWDILSPLDVTKTQQQSQWEFGENQRANSNYFTGRRPSLDGFFGYTRMSPAQVQMQHLVGEKLPNAFSNFSSHVGKAFSSMSQAMRGDHMIGERLSETILSSEVRSLRPIKAPMTQTEFQNFLDSDGRLIKPQEFRHSVYHGGIDISIRRSLWPHLLDVYPENLSGQQRIDYKKRKAEEYGLLLNEWTNLNHEDIEAKRYTSEEVLTITSMVQKDVLRTDRTHKFYAGSEENGNIGKLFNILVTYALNHPKVSYCQGMGDLASPILVVMGDEARSYVCFCGLMRRMEKNFMSDGIAMTTKFKHLALLLEHHDPVFSQYLKDESAFDLFFVYRWLLLELKREFPFDEALMMLEIHWSSFYPSPPTEQLHLTDYGNNVELDCLVGPDDIRLKGKNSSFNAPSFPSSLRSNTGESVMSKSVPPPRPPPPFSKESFASGSSPYQTHYTRLREQVRQTPSSSNSSLRPASPYLPPKGVAANAVSPDVSPVTDSLMPAPSSFPLPTTITTTTTETIRATTAEVATADKILPDIRKPSVISCDGDFNLVFETSLTKTIAMTKTFLDRHLETLSGVTNNSKDSLLKATEKRTSSLKSMLSGGSQVAGSLCLNSVAGSLDSLSEKTSDLTDNGRNCNNPFLNGQGDQNGESTCVPSSFFIDIACDVEKKEIPNTTNPFLTKAFKNGGGENGGGVKEEGEGKDEEESSETGGCDSVSSQYSSIVTLNETDTCDNIPETTPLDSAPTSDFNGDVTPRNNSFANKDTTVSEATEGVVASSFSNMSAATGSEATVGNIASSGDATVSAASGEAVVSSSSNGNVIVMTSSEEIGSSSTQQSTATSTASVRNMFSTSDEHRLLIITDPIEVSMKGGAVEGNRVVLVSTLDLERSPSSSFIGDLHRRSIDSNAKWYCDPFLGHPESSSLKDVVTFLDSCESAHESVEESQEDDKLRSGGDGATVVAKSGVCDASKYGGLSEQWTMSVGDPRKVTATSLNEFDKNVMQTMDQNIFPGHGSRSPIAAPVNACETHGSEHLAVKQRRSSSLSNADIPPSSFGSLSIDFVQVSNSDTPKLEPLPPPEILGDGCPFLLFLCLTLLLQQRDIVLKRHLDGNEIFIHFDKMVRRHRVEAVLCQARHLYGEYLRRHQQRFQEEEMRHLEGENEKLRLTEKSTNRIAASVGDLGISV